MDTIIKSFVGLFFMLAVVLMGTGLIRASIDARNADTCATSYANRIGLSNYSEEVISSCEQDASALGYDLDVSLVHPANRNQSTYGTLTLHYTYEIPILGLSQPHMVKADIL